MIREIFRYPRIPALSHTVRQGKELLWLTDEGHIGVTYRVKVLDAELNDLQAFHHRISTALKDVNEDLLVRIHLKSSLKSSLSIQTSRTEALEKFGFVNYELYLSFEYRPILSASVLIGNLNRAFNWKKSGVRDLTKKLSRVYAQIPKVEFDSLNLDLQPLTQEEIETYFSFSKHPITIVEGDILSFGREVGTLVRVWKPIDGEYSPSTMTELIQRLPCPIDVIVTFQKVGSEWAELLLKRKKAVWSTVRNWFAQKNETEMDLLGSEIRSGRKALMMVEYQFLIKRNSVEELKDAVSAVELAAKSLGEVMVETVGLGPSLIASFPGGEPHFRYYENSSALACILPFTVWGESLKNSIHADALPLHRTDGSLHLFELFNENYSSFCAGLIGKPGHGKSVLAQLLLKSLLQEADTRVMIIDVGSSWTRSVKLLGGKMTNVKMNRPCNLSPFRLLSLFDPSDYNQVIEILAVFLGKLVIESHETEPTQEVKSQLESSLLEWLKSNPKELTFENFVETGKAIPRVEVLKRWSSGVFRNLFLGENSYDRSHRLNYINFDSVFEAANSDLASGGFAAIISQIVLECQLSAKEGKRLVLICDETPIFIQKAAAFFGTSVTNIRKLGQSIVLMAQNTGQLVLQNTASPYQVLTNIETWFLYTLDDKAKDYQERLNLTDHEIEAVRNLHGQKRVYSEFLLKDALGSRKLRCYLTPYEYWTTTSDPKDRKRIKLIQSGFPDLTDGEVIECLTLQDRKKAEQEALSSA